MANVAVWKAEEKLGSGSGIARAVRNDGKVPAIVYGGTAAPQMVALDPRDVIKGINTASFYASLYEIEINGKKTRVLPREVQFHPLNDQPLHVDLQRITGNTHISVEIPVVLINQEKSKGMKMGGILNHVMHSVAVTCPADSIPEHFDLDIADIKIGDSVKSSAIKLPEGVRFVIQDRDFTIVTIVAPKALEEAKPAAAAAAEEPAKS